MYPTRELQAHLLCTAELSFLGYFVVAYFYWHDDFYHNMMYSQFCVVL